MFVKGSASLKYIALIWMLDRFSVSINAEEDEGSKFLLMEGET